MRDTWNRHKPNTPHTRPTMPPQDDDRNTRDLLIGLIKDVQHLSEQMKVIVKLEERILAVEKIATEAKDSSARLVWLVAGLGAGVGALIIAVVPKLLK